MSMIMVEENNSEDVYRRKLEDQGAELCELGKGDKARYYTHSKKAMRRMRRRIHQVMATPTG